MPIQVQHDIFPLSIVSVLLIVMLFASWISPPFATAAFNVSSSVTDVSSALAIPGSRVRHRVRATLQNFRFMSYLPQKRGLGHRRYPLEKFYKGSLASSVTVHHNGTLFASKICAARRFRQRRQKSSLPCGGLLSCGREQARPLRAAQLDRLRRAQETKGQGKCRPYRQFVQHLLKNT